MTISHKDLISNIILQERSSHRVVVDRIAAGIPSLLDRVYRDSNKIEITQDVVNVLREEVIRSTNSIAIKARTSLDLVKPKQKELQLSELIGIPSETIDDLSVAHRKMMIIHSALGQVFKQATRNVLRPRFPKARAVYVPGGAGDVQKSFTIDCVFGPVALEVNWIRNSKASATPADKVVEIQRLNAISSRGYVPVRIAYYDRSGFADKSGAKRYAEYGGYSLVGDAAWEFVSSASGVDFKHLMDEIYINRLHGIAGGEF